MNLSTSDALVLAMFIVSLSVFLQKSAPSYLKIFPVYFICGLLMGIYQEYTGSRGISNTGVANAYSIADFCFIFFVLRAIIANPKARKFILFSIIVFALFAVINVLYIQKKIGFNPVNYAVGSLITVSFCIYYFVELFEKTEAQSLASEPAFWIVSAVLFNTVLTFPMFALISFMQKTPLFIANNISTIFNIIVVFTYLLYSIGFLCRIRIRKSIL
jgi:hypothetical protein